jgi:hypothetical protein
MSLSCILLFLFLATILGSGTCNAFAPLQSSRNIGSTRTRTIRTSWPPVPIRAYNSQEPNNETNENDETETKTETIPNASKMAETQKEKPNMSLDEFLDQPFWDPTTVDENDKSLIGWFARLVQQDYELAETLFVGAYFVILVIVTQEILRFQLYGDAYVPFVKVAGNGKLF